MQHVIQDWKEFLENPVPCCILLFAIVAGVIVTGLIEGVV